MLIALEGIDGCGKSTLAKMLIDYLNSKGHDTVYLYEPTDGSEWGREIRTLAMSGKRPAPERELELFIKDRKYDVEHNIRPALKSGKIVVIDRYYLSSAAYQGARGIDLHEIIKINEEFAPRPDIAIVVDIDPDTALERVGIRGSERDDFEKKEYLEIVRKNYLEIARLYDFVKVIDGTPPVDKVFAELRSLIDELLTEHPQKTESSEPIALIFDIQDFIEDSIPLIDNSMLTVREKIGRGLEWRVVREEARLIVFVRPWYVQNRDINEFALGIEHDLNSTLESRGLNSKVKYILGSILEASHATPYDLYRVEYLAKRIEKHGSMNKIKAKILAAVLHENPIYMEDLETRYAMDTEIMAGLDSGCVDDLASKGYLIKDRSHMVFVGKDVHRWVENDVHDTTTATTVGTIGVSPKADKFMVFIDGTVKNFDPMVVLETLIWAEIPYKVAVPVTQRVISEFKDARFIPAKVLSYFVADQLRMFDNTGIYARRYRLFICSHEFVYLVYENGTKRPLTRKEIKMLCKQMAERTQMYITRSVFNDISSYVFDACRTLALGTVNISTGNLKSEHKFYINISTLEDMIATAMDGILPYYKDIISGKGPETIANHIIKMALEIIEREIKSINLAGDEGTGDITLDNETLSQALHAIKLVTDAILLKSGIMPVNSLKVNASVILSHRTQIMNSFSNRDLRFIRRVLAFAKGAGSISDICIQSEKHFPEGLKSRIVTVLATGKKVCNDLL